MDACFEHEFKFSRWLSDYLDGSVVKRGVSITNIGDRFNLRTKHDSEWVHSGHSTPDVEIFHNIEFDLSHPSREKTVTPPTGPAYIECKMGDAYRCPRQEVTNRRDTGIPEIQREFAGQLMRFQYHDQSVSHSDRPKSTVFVTCPYMLDGVFHDKDIPGFSAAQFEQTLRSLGLGLVYRHKNGIVLQVDSNNSYLVLD